MPCAADRNSSSQRAACGARCLLNELGCVRFVGGLGAASKARPGRGAGREPQECGGVALAAASGGGGAIVVGDGAAAGQGGGGAGATALRPMPDVLWSRTWSWTAAADTGSAKTDSGSNIRVTMRDWLVWGHNLNPNLHHDTIKKL